ncbi:MAG: macro domain-containing protein [Clostridiales bacterium]|jgi:O-acetyl-ADP-ribose deacetylase (regulator of RNase III)|nr:macro domain-containing protein [Clostridiales bacterium]
MLEYKSGDMLKEDVEALVNTVNCVGAMGRGVALQFKKAYPDNFTAYEKACKNSQLQPGRMFVFENQKLYNPRYIINFPTKRHWRGQSRIEDIRIGLLDLAGIIIQYNIKSIALPPLGCGLGGLCWKDVKALIEESLASLSDVRIIVFEPTETPRAESMSHGSMVPSMTAGRAALIELINCYLGGLLDPFITLLELHKLMYFMQEAGEPLKLSYQKGPYGPYAENLRHVLNRIEGHLIVGYADGGDNPNKYLKLVPGALEDARNLINKNMDTQIRLNRVTELITGFETPFGLELLATVHWVVSRENAFNINEIIAKTYTWNVEKRKFTTRQISLANNILADKGWIPKLPINSSSELNLGVDCKFRE